MMKSVTKEKVFHVLKLVLLAVTVTLVLLSLLGTVAHASGLVDDTVNADNLYSKYPLSNYQLDFYVDNSWSWLPWNWLDGIGKSVQYGLYCITNFVWTISLYLSNATGYVVQQAYKHNCLFHRCYSTAQPAGQMEPYLPRDSFQFQQDVSLKNRNES